MVYDSTLPGNDIAINGKVLKNEPKSSCMNCHSSAEWRNERHRMMSFQLPSFYQQQNPPGFQLCGNDGKPNPNGQNRPDTQAMDKGSIAMDFDEVFAFKTLPQWWKALHPTSSKAAMAAQPDAQPPVRFNQYTGAPLPSVNSGK